MSSYYEPITLDVYSCSGFAWHCGWLAGRLHAAADAHDLTTVHDLTTAHDVATGAAKDSHAGYVAGRDANPPAAYASQAG